MSILEQNVGNYLTSDYLHIWNIYLLLMIYLINIFNKILIFLTVRFEILSNIFNPKINPKTKNSMVYNNFNAKIIKIFFIKTKEIR